MRVFLKNIQIHDYEFIVKYPVHGLIFTLNQKNSEAVREIINKLPFYIPVLGEVNFTNKYEIEEMIFFCRLSGIIIKGAGTQQNYSCPTIIRETNDDYNAIININGSFITKRIQIETFPIMDNNKILALNREEFLSFWPKILKVWSNIKGGDNC